MSLYLGLCVLFGAVMGNNANYMTINCDVLGAAGCEQVKAIAIMLDEGRTVGPSTMYGNTTAIVIIVLAATLLSFLLLIGLVLVSRRLQAKRQKGLENGYASDECSENDKTIVNSCSSSRNGKTQAFGEDEVLFRLSMSPY